MNRMFDYFILIYFSSIVKPAILLMYIMLVSIAGTNQYLAMSVELSMPFYSNVLFKIHVLSVQEKKLVNKTFCFYSNHNV